MAPIVISAPTIEGATLVASNFIGTHKITIKFTAGYWWATLRRIK